MDSAIQKIGKIECLLVLNIQQRNWDGIESGWQSCNRTESGWQGITSGLEIGMLLDLDEGTISIYKNGLKLGVMKRGLAGPYCWAVSMIRAKESHEVRIKRETTVSR